MQAANQQAVPDRTHEALENPGQQILTKTLEQGGGVGELDMSRGFGVGIAPADAAPSSHAAPGEPS